MIEETIQYLGLRGRDKVTGFDGTVSSVCFDLYGCVQLALAPPVDKDGKLPTSHWFDVHRIELSAVRLMDVPDFKAMARKKDEPKTYEHGPADKSEILANPQHLV